MTHVACTQTSLPWHSRLAGCQRCALKYGRLITFFGVTTGVRMMGCRGALPQSPVVGLAPRTPHSSRRRRGHGWLGAGRRCAAPASYNPVFPRRVCRSHSGSGRPLLGGDTEPARGTHHLQEAPTTRATSASVLELSARRNGCLPCRSFSPRCVGYV